MNVAMQLDLHPMGDEIQDFLKDITGVWLGASSSICPSVIVLSLLLSSGHA